MKYFFRSIVVLIIWETYVNCSVNDTASGLRRVYSQNMINQLHKRNWDASLFQEVPCKNGEVQTVILRPERGWRIQSPDFPSIRGYPNEAECTWRFSADYNHIWNIFLTCDHFDVDGEFFQGCKDADWMAARHVADGVGGNEFINGEVLDEEKTCGDLTSWVPLITHWHQPESEGPHHESSEEGKENRYETRDLYVKFSSNRRNTATGFSCRVYGEHIPK